MLSSTVYENVEFNCIIVLRMIRRTHAVRSKYYFRIIIGHRRLILILSKLKVIGDIIKKNVFIKKILNNV